MSHDDLPYVQPELYDAIYAFYRDDIEYYVEAARQAGGAVLEIGCGTGRVMLPTLAKGVDMDGLDLDPAMLEVLRAKAATKGWKPRLVQADMRDFTMPRRYALITIPFRAFMHVVTTDEQVHALRCMRDHLDPGGVLRFNVFHPIFAALVDPDHSAHREIKAVHPESGLPLRVRVSDLKVDRVNQTMHVTREVLEYDLGGGAARTWRHAFVLRWTYKSEMGLLLRAAGFQRFTVYGGFAEEPLERDDQEMVWTAWKE
jgi:SAM-dependent methyltransferase